MSPLTKYDTIVPDQEINEIRFRDIDPDVHADSRYIRGVGAKLVRFQALIALLMHFSIDQFCVSQIGKYTRINV